MKFTNYLIALIILTTTLLFTNTNVEAGTINNEVQTGMSSKEVFDLLGEPDKKIKRKKGSLWFYFDIPRNVYFDNDEKVQFVTIPKSQVSIRTMGIQSSGYQKYLERIVVSYSGKIGGFRAKVKYFFVSNEGLESNRNRSVIIPAAMKVNGTIELAGKNGVEKLELINIVFTSKENIFGGLLISQSPSSLSSSMATFDKIQNQLPQSIGDNSTKIDPSKPILLLRLNSDFTLSIMQTK